MKKTKNIPKAFIGFLIISVLIWSLINFSKEYETTVKYSVSYKQLAQNKIFEEEPIKEIDVVVSGSGFKLLLANFSDKKISLNTSRLSQKSKNIFYFLTNTQKLAIQKQLKSGLKLQQILQDTIYLKIGSLNSKKVPVNVELDIQYKVGYNKVDKVKITPDSILISGPELLLKKINVIKTSTLKLEEVSKNIHKKAFIKLPENNKIKTSTKSVTVDVFVDKFTEGAIEMPIVVTNLPKGAKLNMYPQKVKVIYKVGLKNFSKVTAQSFTVVCDYQESKNNQLTYLIPKLVLKPNVVSSVRLVPKRVDFLIQK